MREVRNRWAHQKLFSSDDSYRALDTIERLLTAVSAPQAREVEKQRMALLRLRFDEQRRGEMRQRYAAATEGNRNQSEVIKETVMGFRESLQKSLTDTNDIIQQSFRVLSAITPAVSTPRAKPAKGSLPYAHTLPGAHTPPGRRAPLGTHGPTGRPIKKADVGKPAEPDKIYMIGDSVPAGVTHAPALIMKYLLDNKAQSEETALSWKEIGEGLAAMGTPMKTSPENFVYSKWYRLHPHCGAIYLAR
ncbi:hypothetical protein NKDENANG_03484 [Candidatus Entotheonellaceae bacterium PAL068K]